MRRPDALLVVALAALALGGCRGDDGERAIAAVHEFVGALQRGDGAAACDRLAEAAGVKKRTVIDYETGVRMPRVGTLIAIRRAFRAAGLSLPDDRPAGGKTAP
ncbi:MAG: helix-turn-helix domain-containing protein [Actinobacteria bacterium]|nr:helix-turn-helix domain-containing protein [Actinomycetota bacterium]